MDTALVFMWKLTCETADVHRGFLLTVLSLLNPVIYIWMPWHYTTVSLLPFLSAGIYFGWKAWKAEKLSCKTGYAAVTGVLTVLGMRIRVTEAILLIAFLIMAVCMGGWKKQLLFCVLPFLLMCGMTWTLTGAVRNHYADFDSSDKEFPPVHFVMM